MGFHPFTADGATLLAYRAVAGLSRWIPPRVADTAANWVGRALPHLLPARAAMVQRHLVRVTPELEPADLRRAVRTAFQSYARYYVESFRLPTLSRQQVLDGLEPVGYDEYLKPALDAGRGAIIAVPHLGGWEWAGRWVAERGHSITVVVEALRPPALFDWFAGLRRELGMNVVALGPNAAAAVLAALKDNHVVCLLCDRDLHRSGVPVNFFGEDTTLPGGPVTLALRSGAPLLPTAIYFTPRLHGHRGVVRAPLDLERQGRLRDDVARITQVLAGELETLIRAAPEQWHLQQPNWPSDPGYQQLPSTGP